jgi:hypothetical protein
MYAICAATAQAPRESGTLVIAGQPAQAPLVRINGKSYVDLESLARLTHGTLRFEGSQTILTLSTGGSAGTVPGPADAGNAPLRMTQAYLNAEIAALAQVREWHASVVNAVTNNLPVTEAMAGPIQRQAEAKLQLALAAATSGPDQKAAELLRNEFANMQQMSDQFVAMHDKAEYISPDVFNNNALDAKIVGCQQALASMAAARQFQDDAQCH